MSEIVFRVSGMTCDHCVAAVTEEIAAIPGVRDVTVALMPHGVSNVSVTSDGPLDREAVRMAVDEAGYTVGE